MRHLAGLDYNTGHGPIQSETFNEVQLIKELLPTFHQWLHVNGTNLTIHTNSSFIKCYDFVLSFNDYQVSYFHSRKVLL